MKIRTSAASGIAVLFLGASALGCGAAAGESEDVDSAGMGVRASEAGQVTDYDAASRTVTVVNDALSTELLVHNAGTLNNFVGDPDEFSAGPCRSVAVRWRIFSFQQRSATWFRGLLGEAAHFDCRIEFVRADAANSDGSFDLLEVRPTP